MIDTLQELVNAQVTTCGVAASTRALVRALQARFVHSEHVCVEGLEQECHSRRHDNKPEMNSFARAEYLWRKVNPRGVQQHNYLDIARKYTTPCKRVCYLVDKTRCQPGCVPRSTPANQTHVHRATPTQRYEVAQLQR